MFFLIYRREDKGKERKQTEEREKSVYEVYCFYLHFLIEEKIKGKKESKQKRKKDKKKKLTNKGTTSELQQKLRARIEELNGKYQEKQRFLECVTSGAVAEGY